MSPKSDVAKLALALLDEFGRAGHAINHDRIAEAFIDAIDSRIAALCPKASAIWHLDTGTGLACGALPWNVATADRSRVTCPKCLAKDGQAPSLDEAFASAWRTDAERLRRELDAEIQGHEATKTRLEASEKEAADHETRAFREAEAVERLTVDLGALNNQNDALRALADKAIYHADMVEKKLADVMAILTGDHAEAAQ